MTGTNSSNERLILRQNVENNSNEYFLATYFFGNEIVDYVAWKRHCAITKKKMSLSLELFQRFIMVYRTIISVNFQLINHKIDDIIFL